MLGYLHSHYQLLARCFGRHRYQRGTLKADRFTVQHDERFVVISGDGNVEYGHGIYDCLDLSDRSITCVRAWRSAESGGIVYNPGNGDRIFDALELDNGTQILFEGLDIVEFADAVLILSHHPNDPYFTRQWNLHMMGVHNAWRFTQGSSRVLIGVQDTGLGYNWTDGSFHPQFCLHKLLCLNNNNNFVDEYCRREYWEALPKQKQKSHGTSVHSIISATSNNGHGMSGINWHSVSIHIDVLDGNNSDLSLAEATRRMLARARRHRQRLVVNLSLGGGAIDAEFEALVEASQDCALYVVAAGNDGKSCIANPAALAQRYNNVIAVGAAWGLTNHQGMAVEPGDRIPYSNYGEGLCLMGPAEVIAAQASQVGSQSPSFWWESKFNGTSSAAPNVAGVASLVWSLFPQLTAVEVHKILTQTAYDLGVEGYDLETGYGFVDADAAVRRAMAIALARSSKAVLPWEIGNLRQLPLSAPKTIKSKRVITGYELSLIMDNLLTAADLTRWLALQVA